MGQDTFYEHDTFQQQQHTAAPAPAPCNSTFFSLPKLVVGGAAFLAAFDDSSLEANRAFALAYCKQRNPTFRSVGTIRRGELPPALAEVEAYAASVATYSPSTKATCTGAACPFIAVIECVPAGMAACPVDEAGNIGLGNQGSNNVGHFNVGNSNLGSRNNGHSNIGDMNAADDCVGSYNSEDGGFGYGDSGSLLAPAAAFSAATPKAE